MRLTACFLHCMCIKVWGALGECVKGVESVVCVLFGCFLVLCIVFVGILVCDY